MRYDPFAVPRASPDGESQALLRPLGIGSHEVDGFDVWEDEGGTVAGCPPEAPVRRGKRLFDEVAG